MVRIFIFEKKILCFFNTQSYVNNIGFDSSGTHTASTNVYRVNLSKKFYKHKIKSINDNFIYQKKLRTFFKRLSKKQIIINYKLSLTSKLKSFLSRHKEITKNMNAFIKMTNFILMIFGKNIML